MSPIARAPMPSTSSGAHPHLHSRRHRRVSTSTLALAVMLALGLVVTGCGSDGASTDGGGNGVTVTLLTHDSFAVSKQVLKQFEEASGITVKVLKAGDAGAALNQAILTKDHPLGDVFFGVDNTLLSRAWEAGIFAPSEPAARAKVADNLWLDADHRLVPIDYGDVCVNYDKAYFAGQHLAVPTSLDDLTKPEYRNLLVVENAATSSPGLAFLLASVARFGPNGYLDYWKHLVSNGVQVVDGWEQAYNAEFSGSAGKGPRPLVVSYGSSPPVEVVYAEPKPAEAPTGVLADTCFRQVEFAGVLKGTEHPKEAAQVIDFLLSKAFQTDVPLQMFVYPSVTGTPLPEEFTTYAVIPKTTASLPPDEIAANRDAWVDQWSKTVLG